MTVRRRMRQRGCCSTISKTLPLIVMGYILFQYIGHICGGTNLGTEASVDESLRSLSYTKDKEYLKRNVLNNSSFMLDIAARLWDEEVGCESFRKKHENILSLYSFKTQEYWPRSEAFQDPSVLECSNLKLQHVVVSLPKPAWFIPNWLEGFHYCPRCGISCQISWSSVLADTPDAEVYVQVNSPPEKREKGDPLRVYMSLEPYNWTNREKNADIGIGFSSKSDIQSTYARPRESRQHFISPRKLQEVPLFRATSNCFASWRNDLTAEILDKITHHSFGGCENNVGGRGRELEFFPHCRYMPGTRGPSLEWQEIGHCVLSHYKFSLAIENSRIPDYVSEKMFMALEAGTVPIYFGAPNVEDFVPPESFIWGDSFTNVSELIKHVLEVHNDPVKYMNYFAWRRCGVLGHLIRTRSLSLDSLPCRLCEKISTMGGRKF